jgi:hypothetical protein
MEDKESNLDNTLMERNIHEMMKKKIGITSLS